MKKVRFSILGFLGAVLMAGFLGAVTGAICEYLGAPVETGIVAMTVVSAASLSFSLVPWAAFMPGDKMKGAFMAVTVEVWQNTIEENLFKDNLFLQRSTDASRYVMSGKVVHIPQAGAVPSVSKNRAVTGNPVAVVQRTDTDVTYSLDVYTTDPTLIQNAEEIESSYPKRTSILKEHVAGINEVMADTVIRIWAPSAAGNILRTTGEDVDTHIATTTGTRKAFTHKDLARAQTALNKQKVSKERRVALMSSDMLAQLKESLASTTYKDFDRVYDPVTGSIGKLHGFDIYERSEVCSYTNAGTPVINAYGAAVNADDNDAVLCWGEDYVERAIGSVQFFYKEKDPNYFGDVFSTECRLGARRRRTGQEGIIAIVQAAGAGA